MVIVRQNLSVRNLTKAALTRARLFRRNMSPPEALFWSRVKNDQLGFSVRRQYPVNQYFLDFYIPVAKLCVEIDGSEHERAERNVRDEERDRLLAELGIKTYRIWASDLYRNFLGELETVQRLVEELRPQ